MSYEYESKLSLELKSNPSYIESECEGPIDGITWWFDFVLFIKCVTLILFDYSRRITAYSSEPRYKTASLHLRVLALNEKAAKDLSYAVQIRIGDFTQNFENIAPNQTQQVDAFQSASGKVSTFHDIVYPSPTHIHATVWTIAKYYSI